MTSAFPTGARAVVNQRERWQRGHLSRIAAALPFLAAGLRRRDPALLAQVLDLMVPPLILLLAASLGLTAIAGGIALAGASAMPFAVAAANTALLGLALGAGWRLARNEEPFAFGFRALAAYLVGNVSLYGRLLARRPLAWTRTDRSGMP